MKRARNAFIRSILALLLCVSMLVGTTYAWFSETITNNNNRIMAGNLDVAMYWTDDLASGMWIDASDASKGSVFDYDNWEPGYTEVRYIKIVNEGSLALKYQLSLLADGVVGPLANVIDVYFVQDVHENIKDRTELDTLTPAGTLTKVLQNKTASVGGILPAGETKASFYSGEVVVAIAMKMQKTAGNEYQGRSIGNGFSIELIATQTSNESDSFGADYDMNVEFPTVKLPQEVSVPVTPDSNGNVPSEITMTTSTGDITAVVPAGTKMADGAGGLKLTVTNMDTTNSNITVTEGEIVRSVDVHIEGVHAQNDIPIQVYMKAMMPIGLNSGNYTLHHVQNGTPVVMTMVAKGDTPTHDQFTYDPATGDIVLYMKSFSEVAMVADTVNAWEGNRDYSWYDADATELTIANADQLAAFGAIVGGMAKDEDGNFLITYTDSDGDEHHNDFFEGKTVKLLADINLGDKESENNPDLIFYPIGYWNSEGTYEKTGTAISSGFYAFKGTFDGNGNTIANFYQNTWEMKGDHDWYDATLQYYRDGMGLFGKILGGTVKNLAVTNFSCDSEIGTTGVIAAYADSVAGIPAVFENITITNCNPRVYNIGNGGIVGCAGWYSRNDSLYTDGYENAVTFRNITVDQTNKISALWGSWGVSCAGILGQYYPNSSCGIKLENCHVAAIIDVNNDVCSNYQYYWYRYAGMFIGTIRANTTDKDGYTVADTTGVTATGCTYTMGDWNEYWYCELVKNSLASYTHDHQFGRLEKIAALSEIQDENGNWNKEGDFVIPNADNTAAECYHIFKNSNGELYQHFHDVADESNPNIYEDFDLNGDGELNDLKEDRQCYFIPFNQLLTGLDMGIKAHTAFEGIEFVENGTVKSEEKFQSLGTVTTYRPGGTVTLGQLVSLLIDESKLSKATLYATVSPAVDNDNTKVSAIYSLDKGNWAESSITFGEDCTGAVKIVITDYFYCTPTVIILNEEGKSEKFTLEAQPIYDAYTRITLDDLFGVKDGATIGNMTATVTDPNGNQTTLTGTGADWAAKTVDLIKDGTWTVTIVDDDKYCATTIATFTVNKVNKFVNKLDGDFLYRVGNAEGSTVLLGTFFGDNSPSISPLNVSVQFETVAGNAASGTFTPAATWTSGTIQFSGTGVVKVTISADGANDLILNLEVVDATNYSGKQGENLNATANNVVLLCNIGSGFTVSGEYTVFGNGFTLTYTGNGQYLKNGLRQGLVTVSEDGTLDNLRIVAPIYPRAYMYYGSTLLGDYVQGGPSSTETASDGTTKTRYHYQLSAVVAKGNATISNCYIYGGRNNIFVDTGDVTIKDTILECGTVANIQIQSTSEYTVTLENITTIQYQVNPTVWGADTADADKAKVMLGAGVLVGPDTTSNPTIVLKGNLKQYNWVNADDKSAVSDTVVQAIIQGALDATEYNHTVNGKTASNLCIIYMNEYEVGITNETGLPYKVGTVAIKMNGQTVNGQAYSLQGATESQIYSDYANADRTTVNGDYLPTFEFDLGDQEISYDGSEDTRYLYGDKNGVTALYQDGNDPITLDLTKLATIYKYDGINYIVIAVCKDSAGNALTATNGVVTLDALGSYTIEFTVEDNIFYDKNGQTITKSVTRTYTVPLSLTVKAADIKNAVVNITKTALDGVYTTVNLTDYKLRINFLDCISITDYDNTGAGSTVDLSSNISSAILTPDGVQVFSAVFTVTVTYTDGRVLTVNFSKISGSSPGTKTGTVNTSGGLYFITDGALNDKPTEASGQNICTITSVSFKGNNGSTVTNDTDVTVTWALGSSSGSNPCVTPDTLVTLADGTQKEIQYVTYEDQLLVWNFYKGEYAVVPAAIIFNHGYDHNTVIALRFSDGTVVKVVNLHQFFNADLNSLVSIDANSVAQYVGDRFVKQATDGYTTVTLVDYTVSEEYVAAYGIISAEHYNILVEGMFSADFMEKDFPLFNYFAVGEDMKFDAEQMNADIAMYGLYTYADFAEYLTYEQFVAFNVQYFKIAVEKGDYTYEGILALIDEYLK